MTARRCPGTGRQAVSGRRPGDPDPTEACPVCGNRARIRADGTIGTHKISATRAAELYGRNAS